MAWIKPDQKGVERVGRRLGFAYGIQTDFKIQENYSFSTGIQVNYRGGKLKIKGSTDTSGVTAPDEKIIVKCQYVEIPYTLKMNTNQFGKIRYYAQFGFSSGFLIRARYDTEEEDDVSAKKDVNFYNMNMIIGAGVEYTISGSTVAFGGLEFNNGFLNIFDTDQLDGVTNVLGINVGVLF